MLHQDGLASSNNSTMELRAAKVREAMFEIKQLYKDFRMQICGSMVGALHLYAVQNLFFQVLLWLPSSPVLPSYRAETVLLGFKLSVWREKL